MTIFDNDVIRLCRHLSVTNSTGNCKLGHDCRRVCSHRQHDATRLRCWQICSGDSSRLSPTGCEFRTRQLSRVGGVYWATKRWLMTCIQIHAVTIAAPACCELTSTQRVQTSAGTPCFCRNTSFTSTLRCLNCSYHGLFVPLWTVRTVAFGEDVSNYTCELLYTIWRFSVRNFWP